MRPEVKFWDKMLPDQPEHANLYKGSAFMHDLFEVVSRSSGIRNPHDEFKLEQSDLFTAEEMASNPIAMRFLQFVIRLGRRSPRARDRRLHRPLDHVFRQGGAGRRRGGIDREVR